MSFGSVLMTYCSMNCFEGHDMAQKTRGTHGFQLGKVKLSQYLSNTRCFKITGTGREICASWNAYVACRNQVFFAVAIWLCESYISDTPIRSHPELTHLSAAVVLILSEHGKYLVGINYHQLCVPRILPSERRDHLREHLRMIHSLTFLHMSSGKGLDPSERLHPCTCTYFWITDFLKDYSLPSQHFLLWILKQLLV